MAGETLAVGFEQFVDVAFADAEMRGDLGNRQNGIVQSALDIFQDRRQKRRANGFFGDIGIERSRGHPGRQPDQAFQEEAAVSRIERPGTTVQGAGGRADQRAQKRMVRYPADAGRLMAGKRLFDQIAWHPERSHTHVPFGRMENPEGLIAAEQGDLADWLEGLGIATVAWQSGWSLTRAHTASSGGREGSGRRNSRSVSTKRVRGCSWVVPWTRLPAGPSALWHRTRIRSE